MGARKSNAEDTEPVGKAATQAKEKSRRHTVRFCAYGFCLAPPVSTSPASSGFNFRVPHPGRV